MAAMPPSERPRIERMGNTIEESGWSLRRSLDGSPVGESSRGRGAGWQHGNSRESKGFERSCASGDIAMKQQFDIVRGVANWAFFQVNLPTRDSPPRLGVSGVSEERGRNSAPSQAVPSGLQRIRRSSCKVRSFPADPARVSATLGGRATATEPPALGMSIAQPRAMRWVTRTSGVRDARPRSKARDGHE